MKLRFPIYARVLLWFFLNLAMLAGVFYAVFRVQFQSGLDSLLAGQAGDRIESLSELMAADFRETPPAEWSDVLARYTEAYRLKFYIFRYDGQQIAGQSVELPPPVRERFAVLRRPPANPPPDFRNRPPFPRREDDRRQRVEQPSYRRPHPKFFIRTEDPVRYWVGVRLPVPDRSRPEGQPSPPATLLVASDTLSGGGLLIDLRPWVLFAFGAVVLSVLFWLPMIRGITRSISQMTAATEQVAEGRFDARVDDSRRDELGRLGQAINRMTSRLQGFVTGQKRFLGDVAHELCSPIARIQIALGILEQRADEKQRAYVEDVREEVQHMTGLINELLSFTKAGLREKEIQLKPVNLAGLVQTVVARESHDGVTLETDVPGHLVALAEPDLLARAIANLVRNAIRYAATAGPIRIEARPQADRIIVSVSDCGPGVPVDALQRIFDPFYRLEESRSADTGGVGLGLAIVKTCVEACRGTVSARNCAPTGLCVEIQLASAAGRD